MITKGESTIPTSYASRRQNIRSSALIRTFDIEDLFDLQKYHDLDLTLDHLAEIRKQTTLEEAEEPEPEPKERTMPVTLLTEGLGLTGAGIKGSEDNDSYKQRTELHKE
jgi:hypothetical protein